MENISHFLGIGPFQNPRRLLRRRPKKNSYVKALMQIERIVPHTRVGGKLFDIAHQFLARSNRPPLRERASKELLRTLIELYQPHVQALNTMLQKAPHAHGERGPHFSDDIYVYDSFSTDKTVEIATSKGAIVTQRIFDHSSAHQNWGLQNLDFKYDWVFYIDADERVTNELKDQLALAVEAPKGNVAFRVERRDFMYGRWLKHVQASPYYIRLFRPEKMHYERFGSPRLYPR